MGRGGFGVSWQCKGLIGGGGGGGGGGLVIWFFAFYHIIYWEVSMRIIATQEGGRLVSLS